MNSLEMSLVTMDYDFLAPLACGDVVVEGIDLKLERDMAGAVYRSINDPSFDAGEVSFARHLMGLAKGDRRFVGIPFFLQWGFRHRHFMVRRDSGLHGLRDLEGKRVGCTDWSSTGSVWARAAMREQGVRIERIEWLIGPVGDDQVGAPTGRPWRADEARPSYVKTALPDRRLFDMLRDGQLDAVVAMLRRPDGFYEPNSTIVRLLPDYPRAEREYYLKTAVYPAYHLVAIRREFFDRHPWAALALYDGLERSKRRWDANRLLLAETTPWLLRDIEDAQRLMGADWRPSGVAPNFAMIKAFCDELSAQELVDKPIDPRTVFKEFETSGRSPRERNLSRSCGATGT